MKIKRFISLLLVLTLVFSSVQAMCGFSANAIFYDNSVLDYMIKNPTEYRADRYTDDSFAFYTAAFAAAEAVNNRADKTADDINAAVADLAAAEAALTKVGADYHSALNLRMPDVVPFAQTVQIKFKDALSNELTDVSATAEFANVGDFFLAEDGFYTANVTATGATGTIATLTISYKLGDDSYTFKSYFKVIDAAAVAESNRAKLGAMLALENALNRQAEDYSGGFQSYQNVIKAATEDFANPTTTQTRIDRAVQNINMTVNSLVPAYADYSAIYALVAEINELNPDNYNSFTAVTQALDLIVYDYPLEQQDLVDAMAEKLLIAKNSLTLKISRYTVNCITYDENGEEVVLGSTTYDGTRTYVVRVVAPVFPGYEPDVEYQTIELNADEHIVTFVYTPVIYYAYFNANGGQVDIDSIELTYNAEYGTLPEATRDGYSFLGWFSDPLVGEQIFSETMVTINYVETLYAHWSDVETYTFNFDAGRGTACESVTASYGDDIVMPVPYLYGYTFLGWYYADGTLASYTTMPDIGDDGESVTLTAKYTEAVYDVTLDAGAGSASAATQNVKYGAVYGELPVAVREGYTFNGWFTEPEGGVQVTAATIVELESAHTLYAQYTVNTYTLAFDMAGGVAIDSITAEYGTPIEIPEPTRKDYLFAGWVLDGNEYKLTTMPAAAVPGGTTTVTAVWTLNTHISFYLEAYKTVDGTRIPATTIKAGETIEVEVSAKSNFNVGTMYLGVIFDKNVFQLAGNSLALATVANTGTDYAKTVKTRQFNASVTASSWADFLKDDETTPDINEADPVINSTNFQACRYITNYDTTKKPVILTEKTHIFTLKLKVKTTVTASKFESGLIAMDARTMRSYTNRSTKPQFYVYNPVDNGNGTYGPGEFYDIIPNTDNARITLTVSEENSALIPTTGSTTVFNYSEGYVYGLAEELTLDTFKKDYATVIGTATIECEDTVLKTGSVIKLMKGTTCLAQYTVIIYGDIDSNGVSDGCDSFVVNMIAKGMLAASDLTAAQQLAADPNHDGKIDISDAEFLEDAGLLKATVSQVPKA